MVTERLRGLATPILQSDRIFVFVYLRDHRPVHYSIRQTATIDQYYIRHSCRWLLYTRSATTFHFTLATSAIDTLRITPDPPRGRTLANTWLPIAVSHRRLPFVESNYRSLRTGLTFKKLFPCGFDGMETKKKSFRHGKMNARLHDDLLDERV